MPTIRIIVKGLVQGVGYRYFCYRNANNYGIKGYAKNLFNGDVEVLAQGEAGLINDFIKRLTIGPPSSRVKSIHKEQIKNEEYFKTFEIY